LFSQAKARLLSTFKATSRFCFDYRHCINGHYLFSLQEIPDTASKMRMVAMGAFALAQLLRSGLAASIEPLPAAVPEPDVPEPPAGNGTVTLGAGDPNWQVNYFTDTGCSNFNYAVHPTSDGSCYDFGYSGTLSAALVNWPNQNNGAQAACTFWSQYGCQGASQIEKNNHCSNKLIQYRSMTCGTSPA
jgi:hypothetical protein